MFKKVLSKQTKNILGLLGKQDFFKRVYLAGGTALALQLGHRLSFDLDFYIPEKFNEKKLLGELKKIGNFQEQVIDWQTILGEFPGVKFSIFYYWYSLMESGTEFLKIKIAGLKDIAAMKIGAVAGRGTKRDFVDLYFLAKQGFSLKQMLKFYDKKYKNLKNLYPHILKSLVYFEDAEQEKIPQMLKSCDWQKVKEYFLMEVPRVLNQEVAKLGER